MTGPRQTPHDKTQYAILIWDLKCRFWVTARGIRRECGKPVTWAITKHANGSLPMRFACDEHKNKGLQS